ncbi:MAG: SNF2-related protein [Phycisphaerae bacterium]|nr:SNF2-related protein [Phycisphaerae bacterium]
MQFKIGQRVFKKGQNSIIGVVVDGPKQSRGEIWYQVAWGADVKWTIENNLEPYGGQKTILDFLKSNIYAGINPFIQKVTLTKLKQPQKNTIYSFNASRTQLYGYQYKPLIKYLASPSKRILIADEVGLGKTIEAAYIFQEERVRHDINRVLIVCPSQLRVKWQNEMWERFSEKFDILNSRKCLASIPKDPERTIDHNLMGIASYESIRSDRLFEKLEELPAALDLLIVDEVHHCRNSETKNFRVIESLAESASAVVFLSATPIHTGNKNLYNLMNLLLPEKFDIEEAFYQQMAINSHIVRAERLLLIVSSESIEEAKKELDQLKYTPISNDPFYDIIRNRLGDNKIIDDRKFLVETQEMLSGLNIFNEVLSRTRKREVQEKAPVRNANSISFRFTKYEKETYDIIINHIYQQYEKHYNDQIARFVLSNISRCIASSLVSAVNKYQELFASNASKDEFDLEIEDISFEEENDDSTPERYNIIDDLEFKQIINSISVQRLRDEDTKFKEFLKTIQRNKKVIVFAFFKKSLRYLEERLRFAGVNCVRIDGDVPSNPDDPSNDERIQRILKFKNDNTCMVMLSSQVGSEGLDFQFCDTMVNWDLPWNPMVVEQRIGRIDRLGQKSERIHIINLVSKDTIEERILLRLYERINIFKESIGELEPILGPQIQNLTHELLRPDLTEAEKERKVELSAQAIIKEKENMLRLEKESDKLLGMGDFIKEKIDKVIKLGRFVTGKQLELYINQFLEEYCPESILIDEEGRKADFEKENIRYLKIQSKLKKYLLSNLNPKDEEDMRFLYRIGDKILNLAFYPDVATEHPEAELIHSRHPFVQCVTEYYKSNINNIPCTFRLKLSCDFVESGNYFFAWASVDEKGILEGRFLKPIFYNLDSCKFIEDEDVAEQLMYHMIINAKDFNDGELDTETAEKLYEVIEECYQDYVIQFTKKRQFEAEAIILRRKQALQSSYEVLRNRKNKALETAKAKGRSERVINMFKRQLEKLEEDFEMKIVEIESKGHVSVDFQIEGAGLLRIE